MKNLLSFSAVIVVLFATVCGDYALGGQTSPAIGQDQAISGKVVETMNSGGYTYVLLKQGKNKIWLAVPQMKVKVGSNASFLPGSVMVNYESKTLKRKFDQVIFSPGPAAAKTGDIPFDMGRHAKDNKVVSKEKINVAPASGANAYTVAGLYKNRKALNGHTVTVRGKVVKLTSGKVMGRIWMHIQDGTGSAGHDNDLVVTSKDVPVQGETVTLSGTLRTNKDFGAGYSYEVIVEDAVIAGQRAGAK